MYVEIAFVNSKCQRGLLTSIPKVRPNFFSPHLRQKTFRFFVSHLFSWNVAGEERGGDFFEGEFTWKGFLLERQVETFSLSFSCFEGQLLLESPTWRVEPYSRIVIWPFLNFLIHIINLFTFLEVQNSFLWLLFSDKKLLCNVWDF